MRKKHALSGFSLIELMVGLTISLLGLLALGQIMLTFSQTRNSITQTTSAQSNGVMALYLIEKDLAQAGFSMMELQNCDRINFHFNGTSYDQAPLPTALPATGAVALTALDDAAHQTLNLFSDGHTQAQHDKLNAALDAINLRYGKNSLYFGGAHRALAVAPMRIAFQHIPDLEVEGD